MINCRSRECFRCGADIPASSPDACPDCGARGSHTPSRLRPLGVLLNTLGILHLIACAASAVFGVWAVSESHQPLEVLLSTALGIMGVLLFPIFAVAAFLLAREVCRT